MSSVSDSCYDSGQLCAEANVPLCFSQPGGADGGPGAKKRLAALDTYRPEHIYGTTTQLSMNVLLLTELLYTTGLCTYDTRR
jgi:hypothetical protein